MGVGEKIQKIKRITEAMIILFYEGEREGEAETREKERVRNGTETKKSY